MKVKLLKKVRKRYEIEKIIKNDNPNSWYYAKQAPFFVIYDLDERRYPMIFDVFDNAYERLVEIIREDYYHTHKVKKQQIKTEVVWYPKQHK